MFTTCVQWRITRYGACRLSKIHRPLDCVPTAKGSVTSRGKNEKKHVTVFGDFKGVSIHERRKVAAILFNLVGLTSLVLDLVKGKVMKKSFSTNLSKSRACRL